LYMTLSPPYSTLFPYTTLFRSDIDFEHHSQLTSLKERLASENTINFFKSPADLRALVVNSLSHFRYKRDEAKLQDADRFKEFVRSEEHTSELQSLRHLVCRLLL